MWQHARATYEGPQARRPSPAPGPGRLAWRQLITLWRIWGSDSASRSVAHVALMSPAHAARMSASMLRVAGGGGEGAVGG